MGRVVVGPASVNRVKTVEGNPTTASSRSSASSRTTYAPSSDGGSFLAIVLAILWTPAPLCLDLPPLFMVLVVLVGWGSDDGADLPPTDRLRAGLQLPARDRCDWERSGTAWASASLLVGPHGATQFLMNTGWTPRRTGDAQAPHREPVHIDQDGLRGP